MTRAVIGLSGFINAGKNTAADVLVTEFDFTMLSFAGILKDTVAVIFDFDRVMLEGADVESRRLREIPDPFWSEKLGRSFSPRDALLEIGTDVMRDHFDYDVWVNATERVMIGHERIVITDVRFPNEVACVRRNGGEMWWINRGTPVWYDIAKNSPQDMEKLFPDVHPSEYRWVNTQFDAILNNLSSLEDLNTIVRIMARGAGLGP